MATVTENTRVWVGLKACGCCVAVVVDDPMMPKKETEKAKRQFLKDGLSVVSASWQEWKGTYLPLMQRDCQHKRAAVQS